VSYSITIKQSAARALARTDRPERERIIQRIDQLAEHPGAGSVLKGELSGLRRIRVGTYRVVYELRDAELVVLVVRIGHRREVYRRSP
jgi:mRNA interferase RelE/StbE